MTQRKSSALVPDDVLAWLMDTYTHEGQQIWLNAYDKADDAKRAHMLAVARIPEMGT